MISFHPLGNPIVYRGASMAWKGRQLTGYAKNGKMSTFTYDADGLRGSKTVDGVKTVYQYVGDKLYYEKRGDNQEFYYFYDSYGNLSSIYYTINYNDTTSRANYYVTTNIQGDVTALYNSTGELVARYEYDAWGNVLSVKDANGNAITQWYHIANANPIRYRGYYYDSDLDLYYLQSRYYDSEIGRFINADGYITTGQGVLSYNMFVYCLNNPVNMSDPSGCLPWWVLILLAGGFLFLSGCTEPDDYRENNTSSQNCYSYAFNFNGSKDPGDYSYNTGDSRLENDKIYSTDEMTDFVLRDMDHLGKNVRVVASPAEKNSNETIVAMKVNSPSCPEEFDYHFAVQLSNGKWADKMGYTESEYNRIDGTAIKCNTGDGNTGDGSLC